MYFNVKQTKPINFAVIISVSLHIVIFISFAVIRLNDEYDIKGKISVALIKEKETKLSQRLMPVKKVPSFVDTYQKYDLGTIAKIEVSNTPSPFVYTEREPSTVISKLEGLPYEIPKDVNLPAKLHKPDIYKTDVDTKQGSPKPINTKIELVDGSKFVKELPQEIEKPEIRFTEEKNKVLQNYLALVRKKIESKKRYPIFARNASIEGRTEVRLTILKDGRLGNVEVIRSSGSEILDSSALESIQKASPFPPIPDILEQEKIEVGISLVYSLEKS